MIVRTIRWKRTDFKKLLNYILDDKGRSKETEGFTITHNLYHGEDDVDQMAQEYQQQDKYRKKRKDGVILYHEILSFNALDAEKLTVQMLEEIAHKYIELRNPNSMCLSKPHLNEMHPHIHFCFHACEVNSSKSLRMNNKEFLALRQGIEAFQKERFPELDNSLVYQGDNRVKEKNKTKEVAIKKRGGQLEKEELSQVVQQLFNESVSLANFKLRLRDAQIEYYEYRGKLTGIKASRKYRFTTLGIDKERLKLMQEHQLQTDRNFEQIRQLRDRDNDYDLER